MSKRNIVLRLDERWYDALSCYLAQKDTTVEDAMDDYLDQLLNRLPAPVYERISRDIWEEDQRQHGVKAPRPVSVFCVTQDGETVHLMTGSDRAADTLSAALLLRAYLADKADSSTQFAYTVPASGAIPSEVFCEYADKMRQGAGEARVVLDIDLDKGTFSTLAGADGWQTYTVNDVLTAAWNATIPHWSDREERRCVFAEQLEDKLVEQESPDFAPPSGPVM